MSDKKIKVTDKRMFTPEGELREEFRDLQRESTAKAVPGAEAASEAPPVGEESPPVASTADRQPSGSDRVEAPESPGSGRRSSARLEIPPSGPDLGQPTFFDLVGIVAQPIAIYLGDAKLPDGESAENLELARLHIDLLEVLRQKTGGNLTVEELGFLEDLLYQLRLRYVQKRG